MDLLMEKCLNWRKKSLEFINSHKSLETIIDMDENCKCSLGSTYAITSYICSNCAMWRSIFNFYRDEFEIKLENSDKHLRVLVYPIGSKNKLRRASNILCCNLIFENILENEGFSDPITICGFVCGTNLCTVELCEKLPKVLTLEDYNEDLEISMKEKKEILKSYYYISGTKFLCDKEGKEIFLEKPIEITYKGEKYHRRNFL